MDELNFNQQIDESFENIIAFFNQLALLLKDCDRLMGEDGYTTITGNTSVYDMSKSLLNPEGWVPSYIGRTYVKEEGFEENSFNDIKFITIFLRYGSGGTHDVKKINNIPLIVAGVIIPNESTEFKFYSWMTKSWFWALEYDEDEENEDKWVNSDANEDGTVVELSTANPEEWDNIKELRTFAYPLEDIKNTSILKEKIIGKLIELN